MPILFQTVDKVLSSVFFLGRVGPGKQKRLGQAGPACSRLDRACNKRVPA
ncbi:Uncharacterised protein [Paenibacillus thiaminolyticus]|nr:Uncharacterised protein [Paenibacillus thiaminolyticus]